MVQPLRDSRDHYEELKQIDDAMTEVDPPLFPPFIYSIRLIKHTFFILFIKYEYSSHLMAFLL